VEPLIETVTDLSNRGVGFKRSINTTTSGGMLVFHGFRAKARVNIIRMRTLAAARARRRKGGRPRNLDDTKKGRE